MFNHIGIKPPPAKDKIHVYGTCHYTAYAPGAIGRGRYI